MRILEITGVPCSGKSYMANDLAGEPGIVFCDRNWIYGALGIRKLPGWMRRLTSETYLFTTGLTALGLKRNLDLLRCLPASGWSWPRQLNAWRNTAHKFALHRLATKQDRAGYLLYDEGISHLPIVFATSAVQCPASLRRYYPYGRPAVIRMDTDRDTVIARLGVRGHKMVGKSMDAQRFALLNAQAFSVQTEDLARFPDHLLIHTDGDIEPVLKALRSL